MGGLSRQVEHPLQCNHPSPPQGWHRSPPAWGTHGSAFPAYSCPQDPRTNGVGTGPACWERAELGLWVADTLEDRLREGGPAGGGEGPERAQWMAKQDSSYKDGWCTRAGREVR